MTARGMAALGILALLATGPAAAGASAPPARSGAGHSLRAGERLSFRGSWSGFEAGSASLALSAGSRPGTLRVAGLAETSAMVASIYAARFRTEIEIDAKTLLPLTVRRESEENGRRRVDEVVFDRAARKLRSGSAAVALDPGAHDPVTALLALRTRRWGGIGSRAKLAITDVGTPYELEARVVDRRAGKVELALETRTPGGREVVSAVKLVLEEDGGRRILALETALPIGSVRFDLAP